MDNGKIKLTNASQYGQWLYQLQTELALKRVAHTINKRIKSDKTNKYICTSPAKGRLEHNGKFYNFAEPSTDPKETSFPGTQVDNIVSLGILRRSISENLSALIPRKCEFSLDAIRVIKKALMGTAEAEAQNLLNEYHGFKIGENERVDEGVARFIKINNKIHSAADKDESLLEEKMRQSFEILTNFYQAKTKLINALPRKGFAQIGSTWLTDNSITNIHELYGRIESHRLKLVAKVSRPHKYTASVAMEQTLQESQGTKRPRIHVNQQPIQNEYRSSNNGQHGYVSPNYKGKNPRPNFTAPPASKPYSIAEREAYRAQSKCYECGLLGH